MKLFKSAMAGLLLALAAGVSAEVAVIVNPANATALTPDDVQRLFLGKTKGFPGGGDAVAFNLKEGGVRDAFNQGVLEKTESQVKAYWSQLVFTGKGTPPKEAADEDEMKKWVASNPAAIGYIDASKVDGSVKVVMTK